MTNAETKARRTTESDERKEIVQQREEEKEKRKENHQRNGSSLSPDRNEIWRKQLIESERKRFRVEFTLSSRITRGTKTNEVIRSMKITFQTSTSGETMFASIELVVEEKTFDSRVIVGTNTKILIIAETKSRVIANADLMISNRGSF
jgi:hypothetical protein